MDTEDELPRVKEPTGVRRGRTKSGFGRCVIGLVNRLLIKRHISDSSTPDFDYPLDSILRRQQLLDTLSIHILMIL